MGALSCSADRAARIRQQVRRLALLCQVGLWLAAAACATPGPTDPRSQVHVVQRGETLWEISRHYDTTVETMLRVNRLHDARSLQVGQRLLVPGLGLRTPSRPSRAERSERDAPRLLWPVSGPISSRFGLRNDTHHDGIDIAVGEGTQVHAAAPGRVVFSSGRVSGYGNLIIVRHTDTYSTVYAHNRRNLVKPGQNVAKGQVIAEVGHTGRASGPHLHFEVRRDGQPRNPLEFLP